MKRNMGDRVALLLLAVAASALAAEVRKTRFVCEFVVFSTILLLSALSS